LKYLKDLKELWPMRDPCWTSLLLKDSSPWRGPMLERFTKSCSPWEGPTLEQGKGGRSSRVELIRTDSGLLFPCTSPWGGDRGIESEEM